jgi:Type II CAAX prenyl endopeptidase Rce1-like
VAESEGPDGRIAGAVTHEGSPAHVAEQTPGESGPARRPDTALNRILHGFPRADRAEDRGPLTTELLIVLAVFPLPAVIAAVGLLIARIQLGVPLPWGAGIASAVRGPWLWAGLEASGQLARLAAAALVWYLLTRSGEGLAAIGIGGRKFRMDLALVLPVFIAVQYIPQTFGRDLLSWLHLHGFYLSAALQMQSPAALTTAQIIAAAAAGIVEEIVVLGFVVRRLEQLGLRSSSVVMIAVLVRVSYHLYYGWNAVPIALWALATVLVYLRIRRLLPFILCHIAWDVAIPLRLFYASAYHVLLIAAILVSAGLALWWSRQPARITRS